MYRELSCEEALGALRERERPTELVARPMSWQGNACGFDWNELGYPETGAGELRRLDFAPSGGGLSYQFGRGAVEPYRDETWVLLPRNVLRAEGEALLSPPPAETGRVSFPPRPPAAASPAPARVPPAPAAPRGLAARDLRAALEGAETG